jgi:hypothetical protein
MPCTCLRGIDAQVEAAQAHLQALVARQRVALLREEWLWLDGASRKVGEVTPSPCGRWWARAQCYDLLGEPDLEVWLSEPDDNSVDGWVASIVAPADGWSLVEATSQGGATMAPRPTPSEAMVAGLEAADAQMLRDGAPVTIDGAVWTLRGSHEWSAGGLARVQHTPAGWSYAVGMWGSSRAATGLEGGALLALWRATAALRAHAREVGL